MEALSQMTRALGLEVAAIRKRGGAHQTDIRGGERIGRSERNILYKFPLSDELQLRDDTPIRIVYGQEEADGTIVSLQPGFIIVSLEHDLGPKIPYARLITDDSFLVERLRQRLEEVGRGEARLNRYFADRVIGDGAIKSSDKEPAAEVFLDGFLDDEKKDAVRRVLGTEVAFLWGPPGTGKTTTLARIVEAHFRAGRSVLLVSNTNVAVDTALEKVAQRLEHDPLFHCGAVLRHGPLVKDELKRKYGEHVVLDKIVERIGKDLDSRKKELEDELGTHESEARRLRTILGEFEAVIDFRKRLDDRELALAEKRRQFVALTQQSKRCADRISKLTADLERSRDMGSLRRLISRLNPERISKEIAQLESERRASDDTLRASEATIADYESELIAGRGELSKLEAKLRQYAPFSECSSRLSSAEKKVADLRIQVREIEAQLNALREEVIKKCRVLATTVYRTWLKGLVERDFDVVVIDEASMLMLPMSYYAAGLAQHAVVVAGDFRQLPPIVTSEETMAKEWLQKDVFEKAEIPSLIGANQQPDFLVALRNQYRMDEQICGCINTIFYRDHPLNTDLSVRTRRPSRFTLSSAPLLYVDTSPYHPWSSLRLGTFSRYNLFHALLVRNIAVHLGVEGCLSSEPGQNEELGIVAPYAAQINLIQALLDDKFASRGAEFAATVHRFQGNEKASIIIDLPDSFGCRLGGFMKSTQLEETGARLLNVAVSRAREHVLLVANFEFLREKAPSSGIVPSLLDYFERYGESLEVERLLPLGDSDWIDGLHHLGGDGFEIPTDMGGAFTEGTFYPAFSQDLANAKRSVVIFSPFLTARGSGRWAQHLLAAQARGVSLRLVTRPPGDQGGLLEEGLGETIDQLRKTGIPVDLRARMHEKISIIDGDILWHGSLNILSHRDTSESMLRIPSRSACTEVARFVTTARGSREKAPDLTTLENPECQICDRATIWNNGRHGVWFECEVCGAKSNAEQSLSRTTFDGKTPVRQTRYCPRPACGGRLVGRQGKHGSFLGCTNYPRCRHTENIH
ncbi:MAG: hypothetical protein QOH41_775 [Blastocatellia bacterium]|jgi:superfamily I DNA and/or RNA helicase|nr:hypothetical protein [Blastocatellia bacterium]